MELMLLMQLQLNRLMENNILLYGASGHGKVIVDILLANSVTIAAIIDDNPKLEHVLGIPIVTTSEFDFSTLKNMIISIGNNRVRQTISNKIQVNYPTAIHPTAILSKSVNVGEGTVIMAGAVINPDVTIGKHAIVNTGAILDHDCVIDDFAHVSPGASLAGNVKVGEGTHIGIGATIIQGIKIGKWATVGAGAVIIKDVPDFAVVVGNPGKIIKYTL